MSVQFGTQKPRDPKFVVDTVDIFTYSLLALGFGGYDTVPGGRIAANGGLE